MRIWRQRLWALLGLLVVGCGTRGEEGKRSLVVGLLVPLETFHAVTDGQTVDGATLAIEEVEARGGIEIRGERISLELLVEDTAGQPEVAISKALKLLEGDRAVVLLGPPDSESAIAVAKVAEAHGVPMISTLSTHPKTTRGKKFVFRMMYTDSLQARVMARFAYDDLGARRVALLVDGGNSYSRHLAEGFRSAFQGVGGQVVAWEVFTEEELDSKEQLQRLSAAAPEVLVLPSNPSFRDRQIRLLRAAGVTATFLGSDVWGLVPFGPSAERGPTFFTGVWAPEPVTPLAADFAEAFLHRYGKTPTGSAALAYDAVHLLSEVVEKAGSLDSTVIREVLSRTSFHGVSGRMDFHGVGDPQREVLILEVDASGANHLLRAVQP